LIHELGDLLEGGARICGLYFERPGAWRDFPYLPWLAMCAICALNDNGWALLAFPLMLLGGRQWSLPRTRCAFYGYYAGHLAFLYIGASMLRP